MVDQKVLDAFQLMWGPFPEPVMLIHKNRNILAVNDLARTLGVSSGIKCFSLNLSGETDKTCKLCQANTALESKEAVCTESSQGETKILGYWMPLKDPSDVYVHFGIGTTAALCQAQAQHTAQPELVNL